MQRLSTSTLAIVATAMLSWPRSASAQVASQPQAADGDPAAVGGFGGFVGELALLALLAACAWTVFYVLKRKRQLVSVGGADHVHVQVLGTTSLGVRERVVVLRVRERTLLVGVTAAQVTLLADLDARAPPHSAALAASAAAVLEKTKPA